MPWTDNLRPGDLDRLVTLEQPPAEADRTADSYGEADAEFTAVARVWASVKNLGEGGRGRRGIEEVVVASQEFAEATHIVLIWYRTDVRSGWRVNWDGRYLYLLGAPVEVGRREALKLVCGEKPPAV